MRAAPDYPIVGADALGRRKTFASVGRYLVDHVADAVAQDGPVSEVNLLAGVYLDARTAALTQAAAHALLLGKAVAAFRAGQVQRGTFLKGILAGIQPDGPNLPVGQHGQVEVAFVGAGRPGRRELPGLRPLFAAVERLGVVEHTLGLARR